MRLEFGETLSAFVQSPLARGRYIHLPARWTPRSTSTEITEHVAADRLAKWLIDRGVERH
jgi:hypothetical protein